jgi:hypothetical protein
MWIVGGAVLFGIPHEKRIDLPVPLGTVCLRMAGLGGAEGLRCRDAQLGRYIAVEVRRRLE